MSNLESRVAKLEERHGIAGTDGPSLIELVPLLGPGEKRGQFLGFDADGKTWEPQPGESREQLAGRVQREVGRGRDALVPLVVGRYAAAV